MSHSSSKAEQTLFSRPMLIIGAGLLGASIGLKWRSAGGSVYVRDLSRTSEALAVDLGAGRRYLPGEEAAPGIVVVATPPEVTAEVVVQALQEFPDALVTDVASIKSSILTAVTERMNELGEPGAVARYVPGHPMAGRERSGAVAAREELFEAVPWILCPSTLAGGEGNGEGLEMMARVVSRLGASCVFMEADEHDAAVALISHLPQVAASLVAARLIDGDHKVLALAGNGLKDTTRIAASDPHLWVQILGGNSSWLKAPLAGMRDDLGSVIEALENPEAHGSRLALAHLMDRGNVGRARIPGKHGSAPQKFAVVTVIVEDKPGQMGQLFNILADLGVNVEDVRMEHAAGRAVGAIELSVLPHLGQSTADELSARGMRAYHA